MADEGSRGNLLKRYRLAAGLTQEELAERAGYSPVYISMLERGQRRPQAATIDVLARALALESRDRGLLEASFHEVSASTLVGRRPELSLIDEFLHGNGAPVLLFGGEPGIGKSTLLREAGRRARTLGWQVLAAGCSRRGGQEPFAPLPAALASYVHDVSPRRLQADLQSCEWLVDFLPELVEVVGERDAHVPAERRRQLMIDALARFVARIGGPAGTVLLLDDLQWAGPDAFDVLIALVEATPVRVIAAYRDVELRANSPLALAMGDLADAGLARHRTLGPLDQQDAEALLASILDAGQVDRDGLLPLVERSGGVPFFLLSFAQDAREGTVEGIPWDVTQSIQRRMAALPDEAQELAAVAAVAGRTVRRQVLAEVTGFSAATMDLLLDQLARARIIRESTSGYRFVHDVVREAVENGLSAARRATLHRRVAEALEGSGELESLAYHYARSDAQDRALYYLEQAGDRAQQRYAHVLAQGYYRELIDRLDAAGSDVNAASAREKLAAVLARDARYDEALTVLEQAAEIHRHLGDHEREGLVVARIAGVHERRGTPEAGIARVHHVLALPFAADSRAAPELDLALAPLYLVTGRYLDQLESTERAAAQARGDDSLLARAEVWRGCALNQLGRTEEGRLVQEKAIPLAEAAGDLVSLTHALNDVGYHYEIDGQFETSRRYKERALSLAERVGDRLALATMTFRLGQNAFLRGDWPWADEAFARSAALVAASSAFAAYPAFGQGLLALARGRVEQARAYAEHCLVLVEGNDHQAQRAALVLLAECDLAEQRPARALERLEQAGPDADGLGLHPAGPVLAETYLALHDARARAEAEACVLRARERRHRVALVDALRVRGLAAQDRNDIDEALAIAESINYPYGVVRALRSRAYIHRLEARIELSNADLAHAGALLTRLDASAVAAAV